MWSKAAATLLDMFLRLLQQPAIHLGILVVTLGMVVLYGAWIHHIDRSMHFVCGTFPNQLGVS